MSNKAKVFDFGGVEADAYLKFFDIEVPITLTDEFINGIYDYSEKKQTEGDRLANLKADELNMKELLELTYQEVKEMYGVVIGEEMFEQLYAKRPDSQYWLGIFPKVFDTVYKLVDEWIVERTEKMDNDFKKYLNK